MTKMSQPARRLPTLAAACLLGVALPAMPGVAQEKVEAPAEETTASEIDYSVSIPSIDAVDSNVDDASLTEIFSGNVVDHAEELVGLSATSITVPEITVSISSESDGEANDATITFRDLVLDSVTDGVAGTVSLGSAEMTSDEGTFTFGAMSAANFNIGGVLGIYGLVDSDQTELQTIYTDFSTESGSLVTDDVTCTIGAAAGAEFKARPLKVSFADLMTLAGELDEDAEDIDPALLGQFVQMYADILTAFETSEMTFDGLSCEGTDSDGRAMTFSIGSMVMAGMSPGIYPQVTMDGFDLTIENDGSISLESLVIKETDLSSIVAALESAPAEVDETWFETNARSFVPSFGGFSFTGFNIDIPDPDTEGARIMADIGAFDLTLGNYINGIPAELDVSAQNIQGNIPADSGDETIDLVRSFGVTSFDAGFRLAAAWDEATETIDIEEVSVTGVDLATVNIAGSIANATADLFAIDENTAMMAAMDVAVKSLDLTVVDAGLADILIAAIAAEQGGTPESLRPIYAGLAQGTVIGTLAGIADAAKMGQSINAFIMGTAKTLNIGIVAKEDPGIGMMEFMAAEEDPSSLLGKVNINIKAK